MSIIICTSNIEEILFLKLEGTNGKSEHRKAESKLHTSPHGTKSDRVVFYSVSQ